MSCNEIADLMDAYVDGELTAPQQATVTHHLTGCSACASAVAARQSLLARIRESGGYPLPPGLSERVSQTLTEADRHSGALRSLRRYPWRLFGSHAAAAAFGGLALFLWLSAGDQSGAISDVLSAHQRSLTAEQFTTVASSQSHTVRPWFMGKIDFAPPVADLATAEFPLLGGHVAYLDGRPAAALSYGRRLHRISLFVRPAMATQQGTAHSSQLGYHIVQWRDDTFAYWAISDLNRAELMEFKRNFQNAVEASVASD